MQPHDIGHLVEVADPRVAPDGRTVAFVVAGVDLEADEYTSAVWLAGVTGDPPPARVTPGEARERRPRWSPDGRSLAYVSGSPESVVRLHVVTVPGDGPASATVLAEWPEDIEDLAWTPAGDRLVFATRQRDEARYGPAKDGRRPPRRIDRVSYRLDNVGWTIDRPRHLFSVAADGSDAGRPTALTGGPFEDEGLAVSPDGRWVAFSAGRTGTWDTDLDAHLYRVPVAGAAEPEVLTAGRGTHSRPSWSPDGRHVAFVTGDRRSLPRHGQIAVVEVGGGDAGAGARAEPRVLTAALDRHCAPYLAAARDPAWDGDTVLFQVDEAGAVPLYRVGLDGRPPELVVGGDRQVTGFDVAGGTLAFAAATMTESPDLYVLAGGEERRLTRHGEAFAADHAVQAATRFTASSTGGVDVEAWAIPPVGMEEGRRYPTLVNIHGGPFSQYGYKLSDELQAQAGAGYAVVFANPRGSSGYGEGFARAIRGPKAADDPGTGWGGVDYDDVMAVVDEAVARFPFVDPERLGVLGGSYGGFLTGWIIGHTGRFKAACSERSCNNLLTFAHTSDIGVWFPAGYIGASHLDDPAEFLRQSPVTYYRDMATPLLILHSENDLRCPVEQAEDLWLRLKLTGRTVELVRFPGESHELSRSGGPRHRVERLGVILDWFERQL